MLFFNLGGFLVVYAVMRLQAVLPFNPQSSPRLRQISRSTLR
jgi:K+-transporting ATPase A subunit